jgi:hypothetical protein
MQYATPEEIAHWLGAPAEPRVADGIPSMARPSDERLHLPVLLESRDRQEADASEQALLEAIRRNSVLPELPSLPNGGVPAPLDIASTVAGGMFEGVPVAGPYLREGTNHARAAINSAITDNSYDEALRSIRKNNERQKRERPIAHGVGEVAGGVLVTAPFGGIGLGAKALGASALLGGADAAVRSGGDPMAVGTGMLLGAGSHVVGSEAGKLAAKGVQAVADRATLRAMGEAFQQAPSVQTLKQQANTLLRHANTAKKTGDKAAHATAMAERKEILGQVKRASEIEKIIAEADKSPAKFRAEARKGFGPLTDKERLQDFSHWEQRAISAAARGTPVERVVDGLRGGEGVTGAFGGLIGSAVIDPWLAIPAGYAGSVAGSYAKDGVARFTEKMLTPVTREAAERAAGLARAGHRAQRAFPLPYQADPLSYSQRAAAGLMGLVPAANEWKSR